MARKEKVLDTGKWCGYCPEIKKQLKRKGVIFKAVDIDSKKGKELDKKHNILHVPTMIINGKKVSNPKKWL